MRDLHIYAPLIYLIYLMKPEGQKVSHNLSGSQWIYIQAGCLLGLGWGSLRRFWRWQRTSSQLRLAEERWGKFALVDKISRFFHAHFQYRILPRQDRQARNLCPVVKLTCSCSFVMRPEMRSLMTFKGSWLCQQVHQKVPEPRASLEQLK